MGVYTTLVNEGKGHGSYQIAGLSFSVCGFMISIVTFIVSKKKRTQLPEKWLVLLFVAEVYFLMSTLLFLLQSLIVSLILVGVGLVWAGLVVADYKDVIRGNKVINSHGDDEETLPPLVPEEE
jgi:VIT1/CCC1 family predicted Fe2+/Mn2+ transporter